MCSTLWQALHLAVRSWYVENLLKDLTPQFSQALHLGACCGDVEHLLKLLPDPVASVDAGQRVLAQPVPI